MLHVYSNVGLLFLPTYGIGLAMPLKKASLMVEETRIWHEWQLNFLITHITKNGYSIKFKPWMIEEGQWGVYQKRMETTMFLAGVKEEN
jgi:hypothetical protein